MKHSMDPVRRRLLQALGVSTGTALMPGIAIAAKKPSRGKVVVIGGGFGGATAAKYLRKWSDNGIDVTLIERTANYVSCPMSNEVLGGNREYSTLVQSYDTLKKKWGVNVVTAEVVDVDTAARVVKTNQGKSYSYDRLVVAPGLDLMFDEIKGYDSNAQKTVLHAWKAGPQTLALRKQLEEMKNGGTYIISVPKSPYRCPPGPYERACQVAYYFKTHKPASKVLILDANETVQSKPKLFMAAWKDYYPDIVEYRPNWSVGEIDAQNKVVTSELGDTVKGDVLNILPPMQGGEIARKMGLLNINKVWAGVDWTSMESTAIPNVHVIGDAVFAAPLMPKSGHMANQHGKAVASALVEIFAGRSPEPILMANTCYSMLDNKHGVHVASVHRYNPEVKAPTVVAGSGGTSMEANLVEGRYTQGWALSIWADTFA